ncbi:hypothetical protein L7F22_000580 [Adiantum nelumboides]|nr:hypothetical protein [Adiantum nelumboides]
MASPWRLSLCAVQLARSAFNIVDCVVGFEVVFQGIVQVCPGVSRVLQARGSFVRDCTEMAGKVKKGGRERMRGAYSTPPPKKSVGRAGRGAKQPPIMTATRATRSRAGPMPTEEFKEGQDAPLSLDVPQEPCQDASLKKAPSLKAPKEIQPTKQGLKIAMHEGQDAPCQRMYLESKAKDMIVLEGSSPLKVQKSVQAKKLSGTAGFEPPKTQVNKRKSKADVKEKEDTVVSEQQNVKRLKRMKEVEVREAIERKLVVDEVKVKGHTSKGQLEKVPEVKIALKRDGVKNKAKQYVEKGQEDEGPTDKALALNGSLKWPKLQRRIKVGTLIVHSDKDKSSGGSSGGSDDDGDEDDQSNQDGSGDDYPDYGSNGDVNVDDGGSDISGASDISGGSDDDGGGDISGGGDDIVVGVT